MEGYALRSCQSLCPVCEKPVSASYVERGGAVYFEKRCEEHGEFRALAAENAEDFKAWAKYSCLNIQPKIFQFDGKSGECPLHCGTCSEHLQTACCVLLDVTERCNQSCPWCFARAGEGAAEDPSLSDIEKWYSRLRELGEERPFNIQISGGEPTVRDDLPKIVRMGREKGFEYIQLNTNGRRLALEKGYAKTLKNAGVSVAFLQFDSLNNNTYRVIRGEPLLEIKEAAIKNCRDARLAVTLVPTVIKNVNDAEIGEIVNYMMQNMDVVKGVHFQPASFFGRHPGPAAQTDGGAESRITMFEVMRLLEAQTGGKFRAEEFLPISTGDPLCCFCGSFLREKDGSIKNMMGDARKERAAVSCCGTLDPLDVIRRDRDFVLNKWEVGGELMGDGDCGCGDEPMGFDEVLAYLRRNMFTVSGMGFMDLANLDAERLKRCRVQQFTADGRLIPFCAYNSFYRSRL